MKTIAAFLLFCSLAGAQVFTFTKDQMLKYTAQNPFERFDDGRPKVPDSLLDRMRALSAEDIFGVANGARFTNQFEGGWQILHPGKKLVGRAVTVQFMPARPDVMGVVEADAKAQGATRSANQRMIDRLQPGDVIVVDMFGKVEQGTFVGDNLFTSIKSATQGGGLVVDGSIRDLEGIANIDMAAYFRGVHPSAIGNVMLTGYNIPVRIGSATVMPGDVVFGDREGVYFVPPQIVQKIVDRAVETKLHDEWTQMKFLTGKYKSSDLYPSPRDPALLKEYEEWKKTKSKK
jgi:regulator of RNase E activity RraA